MGVSLLADHRVVLVIGVVGVAQLAVGAELEELVAKLALVADVVSQVKVLAHGDGGEERERLLISYRQS